MPMLQTFMGTQAECIARALSLLNAYAAPFNAVVAPFTPPGAPPLKEPGSPEPADPVAHAPAAEPPAEDAPD